MAQNKNRKPGREPEEKPRKNRAEKPKEASSKKNIKKQRVDSKKTNRQAVKPERKRKAVSKKDPSSQERRKPKTKQSLGEKTGTAAKKRRPAKEPLKKASRQPAGPKKQPQRKEATRQPARPMKNTVAKSGQQSERSQSKAAVARKHTANKRLQATEVKKRPSHEVLIKSGQQKEFRLQIVLTALALVLTAVILFGVVLFGLSVGKGEIVGESMAPTFEDQDKVIYLKHEKIDAFDIVAFEPPVAGSDTYYVKRVIGMPGDTVSYQDGVLTINNQEIKENYVVHDGDISGDFDLQDIMDKTEGLAGSLRETSVIPEDMYLVLGDNRNNSEDSRNFGLIAKEEIVGVVRFRYAPFGRMGAVQ